MARCHRHKVIFWAILFAFSPLLLSGQVTLNLFNDIGANSASKGLYFKSGALASYQINKNNFGFGIQNELGRSNTHFFSAYRTSYSRHITILGKGFEPNVFIVYSQYSKILFERNIGLLIDWKSKHIENSLGLDFRRHGYTNKGTDLFGVDNSNQSVDTWKIIYRLGINLKPLDNNWNLALILSNIDTFVVNNTALPAIMVRGQCTALPGTTLFAETWFKTTGLASISFNPYGLFMRTGISWKL